MEESEAKCEKCEVEVRQEPTKESVLDKMVIRPEALVILLEDEIAILERQKMDLIGTLFGIGLVALFAVGKYTIFY